MNTLTLLTIDPGARFWGVSVFHGRNFNISFIKKLSTKASPRNRLCKTRRLFLTLCKKYGPDILIIEKPYKFWEKQSQYLGRIIGEIKRLARKERIKVIEYSPRTVRKVVCNDKNATKEGIDDAVCRFYPELKTYLNESRNYNDKYWGRMKVLWNN